MKQTSKQVTVRLTPQLYQKAMALAKSDLRSNSELVREALREYIARREADVRLFPPSSLTTYFEYGPSGLIARREADARLLPPSSSPTYFEYGPSGPSGPG